MGVSENSVPLNPLVNDHYPVFKWLFHWEYTQHFQTNPDAVASCTGAMAPLAFLSRLVFGVIAANTISLGGAPKFEVMHGETRKLYVECGKLQNLSLPWK